MRRQYLSAFKSVSPTYIVRQEDGLSWLAREHAKHSSEPPERFVKLLGRYGCGPSQIAQRGTFLRDFTADGPMQIFSEQPAKLDARMAFFNEALLPKIDELYGACDFKNWIHVTCTGYVSPSVIQIIASRRRWEVECLHAYHMGCYAAFPAIRMARGLSDTEILHTELCTLHLDPRDHAPEQLVIQSLFADGVIRYRSTESAPESGFEILDAREVIAGDSLNQMTWGMSPMSFAMTLAREVPKSVQANVGALVEKWKSPRAIYAIHPGGPRIIDAVKESLGLSEEQVFFSREILRRHGNMSSATLPHVWEAMLPQIEPGTEIISMAFGPGLTLSANHMRKL